MLQYRISRNTFRCLWDRLSLVGVRSHGKVYYCQKPCPSAVDAVVAIADCCHFSAYLLLLGPLHFQRFSHLCCFVQWLVIERLIVFELLCSLTQPKQVIWQLPWFLTPLSFCWQLILRSDARAKIASWVSRGSWFALQRHPVLIHVRFPKHAR